MSIKNIEMQDSSGNIYYPHTNSDIVKYGGSTVGATLSDLTYQLAGGTGTAITLTMQTLINGYAKTFIASANNNGVATTINGKTLYKPGTTTAPNLITGKAYTVWYDSSKNCFFIKASAEGNTISSHVLAGDTFSNDNDTGLKGTLDLSNLVTGNIKSGVTINGTTGKPSVVETCDGTITASQMINGAAGYANGNKVIGTMPNRGDIVITPTSQNQIIPMGFHGGNGYVQGVTPQSLGGYGACDYVLSNNIERSITQIYGATQSEKSGKLVTDSKNNCYLLTSTALIKYNSVGTQLWAINNNNNTILCIDGSDNLYITGGGTLVYKYNSDGAQLWTYSYGWYVGGMVIDNAGNAFIYNSDANISKISTSGSVIWSRTPKGGIVLIATDGINVYHMSAYVYSNGGQRQYEYNFVKLDANGNEVYIKRGSSTSQSSYYLSMVYTNNYIYETHSTEYSYGADGCGISVYDVSGNTINIGTAIYNGYYAKIGAYSKNGKYMYMIISSGESTMEGNNIIKLNTSDITEMWTYHIADTVYGMAVDNNGDVWYKSSTNIGKISERYKILG